MRAFFIAGLLAASIALICAGDSSAFGRRHRGRSCCPSQTCCQPPIKDDCHCDDPGGNPASCDVSCNGPCYQFIAFGGCHCGCVFAPVPQYHITDAEPILKFVSNGITPRQLDRLFYLTADHHADLNHVGSTPIDQPVILTISGTGTTTIKDIMDRAGIYHNP